MNSILKKLQEEIDEVHKQQTIELIMKQQDKIIELEDKLYEIKNILFYEDNLSYTDKIIKIKKMFIKKEWLENEK